MRSLLVLVALLLSGCATEEHAGHGAERWTFTQRTTQEDVVDLGSAQGRNVTLELDAASHARQLGGQWHGPLRAGETLALSFDATVDMTVEWRVRSNDVGTSGRCDWGSEGATKEIALGSASMRNTTRTCEVSFTPSADLFDANEPTFRWEARSIEAEPAGWSVRFVSASQN